MVQDSKVTTTPHSFLFGFLIRTEQIIQLCSLYTTYKLSSNIRRYRQATPARVKSWNISPKMLVYMPKNLKHSYIS